MKILIHNLPTTIKNCDLFKLFRPHGEVEDISIPYNILGYGQGHAYVKMKNKKEGEIAIQNLQNLEIEGTNVIVEEWYSPLD